MKTANRSSTISVFFTLTCMLFLTSMMSIQTVSTSMTASQTGTCYVMATAVNGTTTAPVLSSGDQIVQEAKDGIVVALQTGFLNINIAEQKNFTGNKTVNLAVDNKPARAATNMTMMQSSTITADAINQGTAKTAQDQIISGKTFQQSRIATIDVTTMAGTEKILGTTITMRPDQVITGLRTSSTDINTASTMKDARKNMVVVSATPQFPEVWKWTTATVQGYNMPASMTIIAAISTDIKGKRS
jgi:hypothetical protein